MTNKKDPDIEKLLKKIKDQPVDYPKKLWKKRRNSLIRAIFISKYGIFILAILVIVIYFWLKSLGFINV